jgi:proteic killer suppression protein
MPLGIAFAAESLRKEFENAGKLRRKHGARRAGLIMQRMSEFLAATCLEDLRYLPGPRLHQYVRRKGQAKATFSVDLDGGYRILFEADHDPEPPLPGGGVDWTKVTKILIREVTDPHD